MKACCEGARAAAQGQIRGRHQAAILEGEIPLAEIRQQCGGLKAVQAFARLVQRINAQGVGLRSVEGRCVGVVCDDCGPQAELK